jgi:D-serine deaminase-like pyridoxal phosphate-dependent protein
MSEIGLQKNELDTPALWVDLDCLERNITRLAAHFKAAGVNWRPHTKGIKVPAIAHKLLAAGAIGITCAKLGEAEVMVAAGIRDILIANQIVGKQKVTRLANLRPHADVKVAVDSRENVAEIGAAASAKDVEVGVVIEVNTGMNRAGTLPGQPTLDLARQIYDTPGVRFMGLMTWEGHALEASEPDTKRRHIEQSIGLLTETAQLCRNEGLPVEIVSAGGSGTYTITPFLPGVTEIEAGGAIFCDQTYQEWGVDLEPALFVQCTVTSRPTPVRVICDAGFKTLPRGFQAPKPMGLDQVKSVALSAEHGIITLEAPNDQVKVGDTLDLMVGYGDATVFLHDMMYGIRKGVVETAWLVQGRGKLR